MLRLIKLGLLTSVWALIVSSCMSSHVLEDAQVIGKGNKAVRGTLLLDVYKPFTQPADPLATFYENRDIGLLRAEYIYGIADNWEISAGLDLPVGFNFRVKYQLPLSSLQHLHAFKVDANAPLINLISEAFEFPQFVYTPTYIYTFRYDDLLSFSTNLNFMGLRTSDRWAHFPGISAGIHVGEEVRFSAGVSYFDNFGRLGSTRIQYLTVSAGIKYDL